MAHSFTERISHGFSKFFATSPALIIGVIISGLWLLSLFGEKKWHESLVEAVEMLSFLTIFAFQRSQNKEIKAIQIKLDELIASSDVASNRLIKAEEAPEHVLDQVHEIYKDMAKAAMENNSRQRMVDIEHAEKLMETFHHETALANQTEDFSIPAAPNPLENMVDQCIPD